MRIARASAPARAALAGNPSDGYGGAVLAVAVANFGAEAVAYDWPRLEIVPPPEDGASFASLGELATDVGRHGYYGGLRLVKAALKRLAEHAGEEAAAATFSIRYSTTVPRGVGLGGSSAIVIAVLRAATDLLGIELGRDETARLALSAETDELGIAAGPQDRVAEVFGALSYVDFSEPAAHGGGRFERLSAERLPPLWLAWLPASAEPSEVVHGDLRRRHSSGDPAVVDGMGALAAAAARARAAALDGDRRALADSMDESLAIRASMLELDPRHVEMAEIAHRHGSGANYAGSGGAVVGCLREDGAATDELRAALEAAGYEFEPLAVAPAA